MHPKGALEGPKEPAEKKIHEVEPSKYVHLHAYIHAYMPAPKGQ